jgi:hypothetical protein
MTDEYKSINKLASELMWINLNISTGNYKIQQELIKHNIDDILISFYASENEEAQLNAGWAISNLVSDNYELR